MILAVRSVQEAVEILNATPAQNPDALARALLVRAALEQRQGDYTAALASLADAVAARERLHGAAHPATAEAAGRLGVAAFALGSYEQRSRAGWPPSRRGATSSDSRFARCPSNARWSSPRHVLAASTSCCRLSRPAR